MKTSELIREAINTNLTSVSWSNEVNEQGRTKKNFLCNAFSAICPDWKHSHEALRAAIKEACFDSKKEQTGNIILHLPCEFTNSEHQQFRYMLADFLAYYFESEGD